MAGNDPPDRNASYASKARNISENVKIYQEIMNQHKKDRKMMELKFSKLNNDTNKERKNVDMAVVSEYVFNQLKIRPEDILEVDLNTGKHDTKHILLRPSADIDKYIVGFPDTYAEYAVSVSKMTQNEQKVTFRNVPLYIPDQEILNLCSVYGTVEGEVKREKVTMKTSSGSFTLPSTTRFVMMRLRPGKFFHNFYWMEGPLAGDIGRRVTVLHHGQPQQCSFCLQDAESVCLGLGNGKRCEEMGGVRTKMSDYMRDFKSETGYMSLKEEYNLAMAKRQDKFEQSSNLDNPADMDSWASEEEEEEESAAGVPAYIPPIQKKNNEIKELTSKVIAQEKKIMSARKDSMKSENRAKRSKEAVESQLKTIV